MKSISAGILGAVCGAAVVVGAWALASPKNPSDILMPDHIFFDNGSYVSYGGTLTGPHIGYPNNSFTVDCYKDSMVCRTVSFEQIGENQIGDVSTDEIPIIEWAESSIVAKSDVTPVSCWQITLNVDRQSKTMEYVQAPENQDAAACQHTPNQLYRWSVEDPNGWKEIKKLASN